MVRQDLKDEQDGLTKVFGFFTIAFHYDTNSRCSASIIGSENHGNSHTNILSCVICTGRWSILTALPRRTAAMRILNSSEFVTKNQLISHLYRKLLYFIDYFYYI